MLKAGFKHGSSNASAFYHPSWDVRVMVHRDDFLALGDKDHVEKVEATLRPAYELISGWESSETRNETRRRFTS